MDIFERALEFESRKTSFKTKSDRIVASREARDILLALHEEYKKDQKKETMDLMKRLTAVKQKIDKRL